MSVYSSPGGASPLSEFRVEKSRAEATLTLSNGTSARGCFFVAGSSRTHPGPERVKDVLNGETGFLPFEVTGTAGPSTLLFNRDYLVFVKLGDKDEARNDPGTTSRPSGPSRSFCRTARGCVVRCACTARKGAIGSAISLNPLRRSGISRRKVLHISSMSATSWN